MPCAVDRHGVDPVAEHDSHGQLIWGIVEVFRLTGDRAFLRELWPHVLRAVDAIAALRAQRTTRRAIRGQACFGLLPESISHEGYSSRPVHSYWDDFFAVRGLADAADGGRACSATPRRRGASAALRDAMRARPARARSAHDRGPRHRSSFPARSSSATSIRRRPRSRSIPAARERACRAAALARTFERYWEEFEAAAAARPRADGYTPYEVRNAPALVLLGQTRARRRAARTG